ncbi:MAG: flagellar hook-basal body complex protein [Lachnospiraceae bacterium]|nr:flagellar hook-basal body complex protein [Lachnospiraceae bacterium]
MMRSMYSGVAGLKTHQTKMDVIGNNIANVNTVAYKSQSVTFSELMYQTTQSASGPNATTGTGGVNARQIGLGVKSGAINTNISSQGASQTTNNPFDIMITGDAFFVVSNGQENFFTRDGSFYVDGAGNLAMTSNGYNVMGWGVDPETMDIRKDTVQPLRIMSPENLTYPPEATSKGYLSGIIDKNDTDVTSSAGKNVNLQIYDDLGYSYTVRLNLKSTDNEGEYALQLSSILDQNNEPIRLKDGQTFQSLLGDGTSQSFERQGSIKLKDGYKLNATDKKIIEDAGRNQVATLDTSDTKLALEVKDGKVTFKAVDASTEAGQKVLAERQKLADAYGVNSLEELNNMLISGKTNATPAVEYSYSVLYMLVSGDTTAATQTGIDSPTKEIKYNKEQIQGCKISYDPTTGVFSGVNGQSNVQDFVLKLTGITVNATGTESKFENITVDLSKTTMYNNSGSSTLAATSGDTDGLGTGRKLGEMSGVSIQQNGMIYASYDNGQTKLLGQIAVAEFANASGLEKEGDNLYSATLNSGEFDGIGVDITSGGGYMNTGVLEMSNVDLSAEFTEMITTQRGFQANSRIITVSDTLLEELVNLKR